MAKEFKAKGSKYLSLNTLLDALVNWCQSISCLDLMLVLWDVHLLVAETGKASLLTHISLGN